MMYLCLRCNGTGEHEQARDLHRSGGTVPCSDCSGTGKLDERMYQFLKRLGYRVTEEPLPTRSQAVELLAAERADANHQRRERVKEWERANALEAKLAAAEKLLHGTVAAWESLPGGRNYSTGEVQDWILGPMQKAINRIRAVLGGKPS